MEWSSGEISILVGLAISCFVATNLDNLLLLVVLQGANPGRRRAVLLGYLSAVLLVILVSGIGVMIGEVLDAGLVGFLGIVPLLLGCRMLYVAWLRERDPEEGVDAVADHSFAGLWAGTTGLMMGNSGDSIAVLLPLLAESGRSGELTVVISYLVCGLLWAWLAALVSGQRSLARRIERRGEKIVPWVMIGVGIYILLDTATDTVA